MTNSPVSSFSTLTFAGAVVRNGFYFLWCALVDFVYCCCCCCCGFLLLLAESCMHRKDGVVMFFSSKELLSVLKRCRKCIVHLQQVQINVGAFHTAS